jgi:hypothetical protein
MSKIVVEFCTMQRSAAVNYTYHFVKVFSHAIVAHLASPHNGGRQPPPARRSCRLPVKHLDGVHDGTTSTGQPRRSCRGSRGHANRRRCGSGYARLGQSHQVGRIRRHFSVWTRQRIVHRRYQRRCGSRVSAPPQRFHPANERFPGQRPDLRGAYIQSRYMSVAPSNGAIVKRWGGRVRAAFH